MGESEETDHSYKSQVNLSSDYTFAYNILMQVFPYLDHRDLSSCSEVCNMWRSVVMDAPLWSTNVWRCCGFHLDKELLTKRVFFFKKVELHEMLECHLKDYEADIFTTAINLEELVFYESNFNFIKRLKSILPNLNVLFIIQSYEDLEDNNPFTINFFENLSNLSELGIVTKYSIPLSNFEALKQLKHLYLDANFKKGFFNTNLNFLKNLKSFGVGFASSKYDTEVFKDYTQELAAVLGHMPNLTKLQLFVYGMDDAFLLLETVAKLQQLDTLELSFVRGWSKYKNPLQMCNNIKKLKFILPYSGDFAHLGDLATQNSTLFASVKELLHTLQEFTWIFRRYSIEESEKLLACKNGWRWRKDITAVWSDTVDFEPKNFKLKKVAKRNDICELPLENLEEKLREHLPRTKVRVCSEFLGQCEFCPKYCRDGRLLCPQQLTCMRYENYSGARVF